MEEILNHLISRKDELLKMKGDVKKRLIKLKYKGKPQYHVKADVNGQVYVRAKGERGKGKYIPAGKIDKARQIAEYDYLCRILKQIDNELVLLNKNIAFYSGPSPESYYLTLSKHRQKLFTPIIPTDEQYVEQWLSEPYEKKGFSENDPEYYTNNEERVRSKSEIIIANELKRFNIPYKYECPIYLDNFGVIHPDFTAINVKRRKIRYWEHLGKMGDEDYVKKNVKRINAYQNNGVFIGEGLILTMETDSTPLDVKLVDNIIKRYFLD